MMFEDRDALKGKRVVFIGRPVKCKRRDQVAFVELSGGHCQNKVNRQTDIIVLAEGISRDSQRCLDAEALCTDKTLTVINEADFIAFMESIR